MVQESGVKSGDAWFPQDSGDDEPMFKLVRDVNELVEMYSMLFLNDSILPTMLVILKS